MLSTALTNAEGQAAFAAPFAIALLFISLALRDLPRRRAFMILSQLALNVLTFWLLTKGTIGEHYHGTIEWVTAAPMHASAASIFRCIIVPGSMIVLAAWPITNVVIALAVIRHTRWLANKPSDRPIGYDSYGSTPYDDSQYTTPSGLPYRCPPVSSMPPLGGTTSYFKDFRDL